MSEQDPILSAQDVEIRYGKEPVVQDLSLSVKPGAFTVLLGPNGSGKSTVLKSLSRIQPITKGVIRLAGQSLAEMGSKEVARAIGLLAQGAVAPEGLCLRDLVRQGRYPHRSLFGGWSEEDEKAVQTALSKTGTAHLADRVLNELSGGQRQRAWIAMVLAQDAPVLLLDEPTTYLDLAHQVDLLELLQELVDHGGKTVVAVLHDLNLAARYADHLVLLKNGRVIREGRVENVFTREHIAEVFEIDVAILNDPESSVPFCIPRGRSNRA